MNFTLKMFKNDSAELYTSNRLSQIKTETIFSNHSFRAYVHWRVGLFFQACSHTTTQIHTK